MTVSEKIGAQLALCALRTAGALGKTLSLRELSSILYLAERECALHGDGALTGLDLSWLPDGAAVLDHGGRTFPALSILESEKGDEFLSEAATALISKIVGDYLASGCDRAFFEACCPERIATASPEKMSVSALALSQGFDPQQAEILEQIYCSEKDFLNDDGAAGMLFGC